MPVVELAQLRLKQNRKTVSPSVSKNLLKAKTVMEEASNYTFTYYHRVEDPSIIYIVGAWPSVDFHMQEFIPGAPNQELLELFKDDLSVEWMFHVELKPFVNPLPVEREIIAIGRHFVKTEKVHDFETTFTANRHELESHIGGAEYVNGGWRVDDGFDPESSGERDEEFVLFTSWNSVEMHGDFAQTAGFAKYSRIRDHLIGAKIHHARRLDI